MATYIDPDAAVDAARALENERLQAVRDLAAKRNAVERLREELADAERDDSAAFMTATKRGWTADELKKIGLPELERTAGARRRRGAQRRPGNDGE